MARLDHNQLALLAKQAQQGDDGAFAELYSATVEGQLYLANSFLKDAAMAEDVVQEVYLRLYLSLDKLDNPRLFVAYLNRICYNICINTMKKQQRQKYELDEESLEKLHDQVLDHNPGDRYVRMEQSREIREAMATLPENQRAALILRYFMGKKIRDVAKAMNCSESTSKRTIKAGVEALREALRPAAHKWRANKP